MKSRLKINGIIIALAVIIVAFYPGVFLRSPESDYYNVYAKIFGIAFIIFGQMLRACGRGYKSEHSQSGHSLIQSGPYALVRNPMYLGIFLVGLGIVLALFRPWVILIFLVIFIWRYIFLALQEEKRLLAMFPRDYPGYLQRVPRILPAFTAILRKDISDYLPLKVRWLKKEFGPAVAILFFVFILDGWQGVRNMGLKAYMKDAVLFIATIAIFILLIIYLISRTHNHQKDASSKK